MTCLPFGLVLHQPVCISCYKQNWGQLLRNDDDVCEDWSISLAPLPNSSQILEIETSAPGRLTPEVTWGNLSRSRLAHNDDQMMIIWKYPGFQAPGARPGQAVSLSVYQ